MNRRQTSNAAGFVRVGLAALFFGVACPVYCLTLRVPNGTDLTSIAFPAGVFFVALGVAIRHGWLVAAPTPAVELERAADGAALRR